MTALNYTQDALFCKFVKMVLNVEGKYVNDPDDPGGPTNHGIAWNYDSQYLIPLGITKDTMKDLTVEQASEIYYEHYWLKSNAHLIPDAGLAYLHFDAAVNCGPAQAALFLSRLSDAPENYEANGKNRLLWMRLVYEYVIQRLNFYTHAKGREKYLEGWDNRLIQVANNALQMENSQ